MERNQVDPDKQKRTTSKGPEQHTNRQIYKNYKNWIPKKDGQFTKVKNRAIQRKRIRQAVRRHLNLREETESI